MINNERNVGYRIKVPVGRIKFPSIHALTQENNNKIMDLEHWCAYILGIEKGDVGKCITYTLYRHKNVSGMTTEYWDACFYNEIIDVKLFLSQAQFCFDYKNSMLNEDNTYRVYQNKTMAKNHLLLLLVLKIEPLLLSRYMMKGTDIPIIIHSNICGKNHKTYQQNTSKGEKNIVYYRWLVCFI